MSEDTKYHEQYEPPNIRGFSAFDLDRLERKLAAVTQQRDRLAEELYALKKSILDLSHPNMKLLLEERDTAVNNYETAVLREHRMQEQRDDAIVEAINAVNDIISVRWKLKQAEETAERYRLDANRLEAEAMMLKEKLKEYDDTLAVCTDNFSCKTFVPLKWELPPYDKQGKGTPIQS